MLQEQIRTLFFGTSSSLKVNHGLRLKLTATFLQLGNMTFMPVWYFSLLRPSGDTSQMTQAMNQAPTLSMRVETCTILASMIILELLITTL